MRAGRHLDQALLAALARGCEQLAGAAELLAMDGQMLGGGEEVVAGQAGVGVRAGLLQRQPAGAVRQRLLGPREPYVFALADRGWRDAVSADPTLAGGLNVCAGRVTHPAVAAALGLDYTPIEDVLGTAVHAA